MRIIAGKYKGRVLASPNDRGIRPTSSMLRESLFNVLSNIGILENARVLDICCGTGAYGIEALSRGASKVVFIDGSSDHLYLARQNVESLGEQEKSTFIRSRAEKLPKAKEQFNLIFIDPPYFKKIADYTLISLLSQEWIEEGGYVIVEQAKREDLSYSVDHFQEVVKKVYGNSKFLLLRKI